jgi:hypothetical protein
MPHLVNATSRRWFTLIALVEVAIGTWVAHTAMVRGTRSSLKSDSVGRTRRLARRHALAWTAGLALLACISACTTAGSAPSRAGTAPKATTSTTERLSSVAVLSVPADPWCSWPTASVVATLRSDYRKAYPAARPVPVAYRLLLVGDSTACTLLPGLVAASPYYGIEVEDAAVIGCGVVSGRIAPYLYYGVDVNRPSASCQAKALTTETTGVKDGKPDIVLWSSTWERAPLLVTTADGKQEVAASGSALWHSTLLQRIAQRLHLLRSGGATVVLLGQPPFVDLGKVTGLSADDREFLTMNALLQQVAAGTPGVEDVDLSPLVCPGGPPCTILVHGLWLRGDGEHYMGTGALWVAEWLFPRLVVAKKSD